MSIAKLPAEKRFDTTVLVVVSLLDIAPKIPFLAVAPLLNLNLPDCWVTPEDVSLYIKYLTTEIPDWIEFLQVEGTGSEGFRLVFDFLTDGLLGSKAMPAEELTMVGLVKTLGKIIYHARDHAISKGVMQRRSFERTREGDASGYMTDGKFRWWDHPGNIGL